MPQEYLSVLYLKPRTQIILREKKVMAKLISKRLMYIEHDVYKPQFSVSFPYNIGLRKCVKYPSIIRASPHLNFFKMQKAYNNLTIFQR